MKNDSEPVSEFFLLSIFTFSPPLLPPLLFFPRLTLIDLRESVDCEAEDSPKSRRTTLRLFCCPFSSTAEEDDDFDVCDADADADGMSKSMRFGEGDFLTFLGGLGGGDVEFAELADVPKVVSFARGNMVGVGDLDEWLPSSMGKSSCFLLFLGVNLLNSHLPAVIC